MMANASEQRTKIATENRAAARAFDGESQFRAVPIEERRVSWMSSSLATLVLFSGLVVIGLAVLLPAREQNRKLEHEYAQMQTEVDFVNRQIEINRQFLDDVTHDPELVERLLMRQTNRTPEGKATLDLQATPANFSASPFGIMRLNSPPEPLPYQSDLPVWLEWTTTSSSRVIGISLGLFGIASALILAPKRV